MLFVGLTEEHKESATMFANVVGAQVISQLMALNSTAEQTINNDSGTSRYKESNYRKLVLAFSMIDLDGTLSL